MSRLQPDSLQAVLSALRSQPSSPAQAIAWQTQSALDATRGRAADAERAFAKFVAVDSAAGTPVQLVMRAGATAISRGWLLPHPAAGVAYLDSVVASPAYLSLTITDRQYPVYAVAYAQLGQPARARALLARTAREVRDPALLRFWSPTIHAANAEIALAENRPRDAIPEFRKSDSLPDGPQLEDPLPALAGLARAFDLANQPDSAIVYFEQYARSLYHVRLFDDAQFLAGTYKRLGELYEEKGDIPKAIDYTQRFLDLWRNADPELQPTVNEAAARLARLRRRPKSG